MLHHPSKWIYLACDRVYHYFKDCKKVIPTQIAFQVLNWPKSILPKGKMHQICSIQILYENFPNDIIYIYIYIYIIEYIMNEDDNIIRVRRMSILNLLEWYILFCICLMRVVLVLLSTILYSLWAKKLMTPAQKGIILTPSLPVSGDSMDWTALCPKLRPRLWEALSVSILGHPPAADCKYQNYSHKQPL